jgi:hypothetical protein
VSRIVVVQPGQTPYVELAHFDDGGGYSWSELAVYHHDGRLFISAQGGCSCNSWETPEESDLVEVTTLAAAEREYAKAFEYCDSFPAWVDVAERFRAWGLR